MHPGIVDERVLCLRSVKLSCTCNVCLHICSVFPTQSDPNAIEQTLSKGEKELQRLLHPDPLIGVYHAQTLQSCCPTLYVSITAAAYAASGSVASPDWPVFFRSYNHTGWIGKPNQLLRCVIEGWVCVAQCPTATEAHCTSATHLSPNRYAPSACNLMARSGLFC